MFTNTKALQLLLSQFWRFQFSNKYFENKKSGQEVDWGIKAVIPIHYQMLQEAGPAGGTLTHFTNYI